MGNLFSYDLREELPLAERGSGSWLYDSEGEAWLDASAGAGAVTLGYGREEISDAIAVQARKLSYAYAHHFKTQVQEDLASAVARLAPEPMELVYFTCGGSEANESAVKIARQYHLESGNATKYRVLSRWPSYHGNTLAMLSLSGRPDWQRPYEPLLSEGAQVLAPYRHWRRYLEESDQELSVRCARDLEQQILRIGPEYVSAFIVEPIIGGSAPAVSPTSEYWSLVRETCDRYNVLLIADEVFTGFGRTGEVFALDHWGVVPDLITCGKGISSGYAPLGAVIVHRRIAEAIRAGSGRLQHSFTYAGHPLSVAAGAAAVAYLEEHECTKLSARSGSYLYEQLVGLAQLDGVAEVRGGRGMLIGIEFETENELAPRVPTTASQVVRYARERHVLISPAVNGDQIQLMPPLTSSSEDLDRILEVVSSGVRDLAARTDGDRQ